MRSRCSREPRAVLLGVVACFSVGVVEVLLELVLDTFSGTGISTSSTSFARTLSRAWVPCSATLASATCFLMSSFSSSMVSNSEASCANSSSAAGSSRSLTAESLTLMTACSPACSPPESLVSRLRPRQRTGRSEPRQCRRAWCRNRSGKTGRLLRQFPDHRFQR